jgi:phosphate starvation-inducible protein PhoH
VQDILGAVDGIAFVRFGHEDVVRHKLVQRIVEAYKLHAEETEHSGGSTAMVEIEVANRSGAESIELRLRS